jgi:hypothetical protein
MKELQRAKPRETFAAASTRLLEELAGLGWQSASQGRRTSPAGDVVLWFQPKSESVYFSEGGHGRGNAGWERPAHRSLYVDRRGMTAAKLLAALDFMRAGSP